MSGYRPNGKVGEDWDQSIYLNGLAIPKYAAQVPQPTDKSLFLPGVPATYVLDRLAKAGGHETSSGKLASPESSAALAVNTFAWFNERPSCLPPFPMLGQVMSHATCVEVEYFASFHRRYPWLDAFIETAEAIIGVEAKRFEPFRGAKAVELSPAYDRDVWLPDGPI
jgi:hypothetical protein